MWFLISVSHYTFIPIISRPFTVRCRDLALDHLPLVRTGGSWGSFERNGTALTSLFRTFWILYTFG